VVRGFDQDLPPHESTPKPEGQGRNQSQAQRAEAIRARGAYEKARAVQRGPASDWIAQDKAGGLKLKAAPPLLPSRARCSNALESVSRRLRSWITARLRGPHQRRQVFDQWTFHARLGR